MTVILICYKNEKKKVECEWSVKRFLNAAGVIPEKHLNSFEV